MAKKGTFTCGTSTGHPERERWARLALSGSQFVEFLTGLP